MSTNEFAVFEALDLAPIKMKLMHAESGEGWSALRADAVETEYRRFLFLMKKYPDAQASPTVDVDVFWHYHILDTMKYARDCEAVFGYFLHHYPYVGIGAGVDEEEHLRGGERMREIYEAEFGAATDARAAWCTAPGKALNTSVAGQATAWCTAPGKPAGMSAWCTAPGKELDANADGVASAWCTAPGKPAKLSAWCTAPGKRLDSTAWCTAPGKGLDVSVAGAASAWCTAPGKPHAAMSTTASAWRTALGKRFADSAWCTAPGKALVSGNSAQIAAWCTAPGKQPQVQAWTVERGAASGQDLAHAA